MTKQGFAQEQLQALANVFTTTFENHRKFPLDAVERLTRGERLSLYSGTPEEWTVALHVELNTADNTLSHTLALTQKPLPPRMREHLAAAATRFEEAVHGPHKP